MFIQPDLNLPEMLAIDVFFSVTEIQFAFFVTLVIEIKL